MIEPIVENMHVYYQLRFSLQSSLMLGSGQAEMTDHDLLLDGADRPYIPGTTIAGMLRALASEADRAKLFGDLSKGQSPLFVYDAVCVTKDLHFSIRDNVALDEYKTARDKMKLDYQVLEPDAEFVCVLEMNKDVPVDIKNKVEQLIALLVRDGCAFGSKKNRGMGCMKISARRRTFCFGLAEQKKDWLDFDPFDEKVYDSGDVITAATAEVRPEAEDTLTVTMGLRLTGGLSIRVYTTEVNGADYQTIAYERDQNGGKPNAAIVPGTSWAGAFRSRVQLLAGDAAQALFGYVIEAQGDMPTRARQSYVRFSETVLIGGAAQKITRNAIDRMTGKTRDGALYTEQMYYGGTGELCVSLRRLQPDDETADAAAYAKACRALGAAMADLHHGYLAVGGLTSVGRGLFAIEELKVDGKTYNLHSDGWENRLIEALGSNAVVRKEAQEHA